MCGRTEEERASQRCAGFGRDRRVKAGLTVGILLGGRLNYHGSGHFRMYGAKIFISAGCRKREGELIVREEHRRSKLLRGRNDSVWNVVLIGPRHGASDL